MIKKFRPSFSSNRNTSLNVSPAYTCMLKVNNRNTRKRYETCSKLTIKAPKQRQGKNLEILYKVPEMCDYKQYDT